MSSESVCQVARSWVEVGSFPTLLVAMFMNFTASVRNILDTPSQYNIMGPSHLQYSSLSTLPRYFATEILSAMYKLSLE
jgi:hypothetical protein